MLLLRKLGIKTIMFLAVLTSFIFMGAFFYTQEYLTMPMFLGLTASTIVFIVLNLVDRKQILKREIENMFKEAEKNIQGGRWNSALTLFDRILEYEPGSYKVLMGKGYCYRQKAEYRSAIRLYKEALNSEDNHLEAHFLLGICYFEERLIKNAMHEFERVIEMDPDFMEAYLFLGDLHNFYGNNREARAYYNKYLNTCQDEKIKDMVLEKLESVKDRLDVNKKRPGECAIAIVERMA